MYSYHKQEELAQCSDCTKVPHPGLAAVSAAVVVAVC
jgi:hypothetical protein